ncbi:nucleotide exchange factor GrpE [Nocardioides euryhalodurans]|nr:nucleotide exchange factor GrpE [Nocardioides euryhalodurans]
MTQSPHGFGDEAAEMANETEVEAALREQAASAPAAEEPAEGQDISGVDNWVEEGGPLEPSDVAEVEQEVAAAGDDVAVALAERTADLQRLQAEFLNYKRRVDRDRELHAENARYQVLVPIIEVLDTVDRAKEHGDLDDGFRAVAEQLERVVTGLGLARFGEVGEPFDPNLHEALSHIGEDPDVAVTTCKVIAKAGYRIGDRVVRAAQVLVVDPAS